MIEPLQIGGMNQQMLTLIAIIVVVILVAGVGVYLWYTGKIGNRDLYGDLAKGLEKIRGDADALALLPYDDGTFWLKPCNFDKDLIGGQGGYETDDGDKIVLDGDGQPVRELLGTQIILGVDPTEHAAAVEPIKALIAQENNMGRWIKVDREMQVIETGEAITQAPDSDIDVGPEDTAVEDHAEMLADGARVRKEVMFDRALEELEKAGEVRKLFDLAPPAAPVINEDGDVELEEATHIAVDQSKAADLMPTTTSTTELNTALDKARMEEHEPRSLQRDMMFLAAGAIIAVIFGGVMVMVNAFV